MESNKHNKLTNEIDKLIDTENILTAARGVGARRLGEKNEEIKQ